MSEPVADHVPPLPPLPPADPARLDVESAAEQAIDLDAAQSEQTAEAPPAAPSGRHRVEEPEPLTRAQRRALAEQEARGGRRGGGDADESILDHPAVLIGLSVLTLIALVVGIDQASQGNVILLLPAAALVAAYVVVVRRRRARR
jgi:hypothetical protein